jgi:hypothetical protein
MAQSQPILGGYVPFYGTYIQVIANFRTTQRNERTNRSFSFRKSSNQVF